MQIGYRSQYYSARGIATRRTLEPPFTLVGQHRTLAEAVTTSLRQAILTSQLRPGDRLWQDRLSHQFGVSRIPVREALRQLASEGLVTLQAHRNAIVTDLTAEELEQLYAIGGTLEALAAARGVPNLTDSHLDEMRDLLDQMPQHEDRPQIWFELNLRFHMVVPRASGWQYLIRLIEEARKNLGRYVTAQRIYEANLRCWHAQHTEYYRACHERDVAEARRVAESHWTYSSDALQSYIRSLKVGKSAEAHAQGAIAPTSQHTHPPRARAAAGRKER